MFAERAAAKNGSERRENRNSFFPKHTHKSARGVLYAAESRRSFRRVVCCLLDGRRQSRRPKNMYSSEEEEEEEEEDAMCVCVCVCVRVQMVLCVHRRTEDKEEDKEEEEETVFSRFHFILKP